MSDDSGAGDDPVTSTSERCPWCSAPLPSADLATCPSCGASLHGDVEGEVPGVTKVDHEGLLRSRNPIQKSRGLMGWLSGEYDPGPTPERPETLALPDADVRREMIRLELAALEAEAQARRIELELELAEAGIPIPTLESASDAEPAADSDGGHSAGPDPVDESAAGVNASAPADGPGPGSQPEAFADPS
jgi:hypothetical protein